jgi:hypothetical protein
MASAATVTSAYSALIHDELFAGEFTFDRNGLENQLPEPGIVRDGCPFKVGTAGRATAIGMDESVGAIRYDVPIWVNEGAGGMLTVCIPYGQVVLKFKIDKDNNIRPLKAKSTTVRSVRDVHPLPPEGQPR